MNAMCKSTRSQGQQLRVCTLVLLANNLFIQCGFTALYIASSEGYTDVVDLLLQAGADVNQVSTKVSSL